MQQHTVITLKNEGDSNREVARKLKIGRKTVARYWNEYKEQVTLLGMGGDTRGIQEAITKGPSYDTTNRRPFKYTPEIDALLDEILALEEVKKMELGTNNKQMLTMKEIHKMIVEKGHDIGVSTISNAIRAKREQVREAFIRQEYDLANRLEYDFGEVTLIIGGVKELTIWRYLVPLLPNSAGPISMTTRKKKCSWIATCASLRWLAASGARWYTTICAMS